MKVQVIDPIDINADAEDMAMIAAKCSRSLESFDEFIKEAMEANAETSGNFMRLFNVGFSHKSIADCGSTTIYFENISIVAAKAIENSKLFNGQETSTRYNEFGPDRYFKTGIAKVDELSEMQMVFVQKLIPRVQDYLVISGAEENATEAYYKALDIARGYLPASTLTNCAWHTTLSHARSNVMFLLTHPLEEVRIIGSKVKQALIKRYEGTFDNDSMTPSEYEYGVGLNYSYASNPLGEDNKVSMLFHPDSLSNVEEHKPIFEARSKRESLPRFYDFIGDVRWDFSIDYGSFRDIQRQRNSDIYQPILNAERGFHDFYHDSDVIGDELSELCETHIDTVFKALACIDIQEGIIEKHSKDIVDPYSLQLAHPLGTIVQVSYRSNLNQMIYVCELRCTNSVHPILRKIVRGAIKQIESEIPFVNIHMSDRHVERSKQSIMRTHGSNNKT